MSHDTALALSIGLSLAIGACIGATLALRFSARVVDRILKNCQAPVELRITPEVAQRIVNSILPEYLKQHGMTLMPRGVDFKWPGEPDGTASEKSL